MQLAIASAADSGEDVPVGAVLVDPDGEVSAVSHNLRERTNDPTAHAEVVAIREAAANLRSWRLDGYTIFVTLEPCLMCAAAISAAKISRVVFGAWDLKRGALGSKYDVLRDQSLGPQVEVIPGILEDQCSSLLTRFFANHRAMSEELPDET